MWILHDIADLADIDQQNEGYWWYVWLRTGLVRKYED
jgi:hypothetical protein